MKRVCLPRQSDSIGLIGHTVIGYPDMNLVKQIVEIMVLEGVSLIELQIPFSEPIADGPIFAQANHEAIAKGVNLKQCFELMAELTQKHAIPFVFMTYANIVYRFGFEKFVRAAKENGAVGAIIPDLPFDLATELLQASQEHDFFVIPVIPPNISSSRLRMLCQNGTGFIYAVARSGVTGSKTQMGEELIQFIQRIREQTDLPIAVGFGVSSAKDIQFLKSQADYAIIGTQTIRSFEDEGLSGVRKLWQELTLAAG